MSMSYRNFTCHMCVHPFWLYHPWTLSKVTISRGDLPRHIHIASQFCNVIIITSSHRQWRQWRNTHKSRNSISSSKTLSTRCDCRKRFRQTTDVRWVRLPWETYRGRDNICYRSVSVLRDRRKFSGIISVPVLWNLRG